MKKERSGANVLLAVAVYTWLICGAGVIAAVGLWYALEAVELLVKRFGG